MNKLRILLLSVSSTTFFYDQLVIPFGLVSIASYVDNPDCEIKGIEMNSPPRKIAERYLQEDRDILEEILGFHPHILAMSTYATNMYNVMFWADAIKRNLPETFIVVGGNHVSYIAEECLRKCKGIDAVVRFEGEIPFKMLCERMFSNNRQLSDIPNLTYRDKGEILETPRIDLIKDLNSLPILNRTYFAEDRPQKKAVHADIISSRGCPFNCTFCNCNHYWSKRHRTRSMRSVIEELKELTKRYPLESVRFRDESITLNKRHCMEICDEILANGIHLSFQAHSRLDGLDEEVIRSLAKAGFKMLFIGVESGSRAVLKRLQKGIDIARLESVIGLLRKYGVAFRLSFMSATPGEGFFKTMETVRLIKRLRLKSDEYYLGYGVDIYPGTEECRLFLQLHPDFEWINRDYSFKGKYLGMKDPQGNIIQPKYREYGLLTIGIVYLLLRPAYFFEKALSLGKKTLARFLMRAS